MQRLPHPLLKRGAAHVQRQVQPQARRLDKGHYLGYQRFKHGVTADQVGVRKPVLQVAHQHFGIVPQQDRADAPFALRH
ncbi:hypothetical protein D3C72_2028260 [compost metagenome]